MRRKREKMEKMSDEVNEILCYYNPYSLSSVHYRTRQYYPEAGAIVCYLKDVTDKTDLRWLIHKVCNDWSDFGRALPSSHRYYRYMAEEIWELWQEVIEESEAESRGEVKQVKEIKTYKETFHASVMEILYEHDPLSIMKFGVPDDEYTAEAADIISHLKNVSDVRSLKWLVYEVFRKYFSTETIASYRDERYQHIAEGVWEYWQKVIEEDASEGA